MLGLLVSFLFVQDLRDELEGIRERAQSRYAVLPAEICRRLEEVHLSIQKEEERVTVPFLFLDFYDASNTGLLSTVRDCLQMFFHVR